MNFKRSLLPAFLRRRILVVDCGAHHVACGWFTVDGGSRLVLKQFVFEPHSRDYNPESNWSEATGRALGMIARRGKFAGTCRLALPGGHHLLVKFVRTPAIEKARRGGIIAFEAQKNIPCPLEQVVWDHLTVADDGTDLDIMLAAVKREVAGAVHRAAGMAGFHVAQMVPSCVALLRAFRYLHPDECDRVLVAEIGARATHLVFIEGARYFIRTFLLGGDAVTQALADELHLDFMTAETLKTEAFSGHLKSAADSPAQAAVQRAAAHFAGRLHLEIVRSTIDSCGHPGPARPLTIYLTGGGSLIPELPVILADKLTLRVVRLEPLRHIMLSAACAGAEAVAPMLADLVGLATSLIDDEWPRLNLLPPNVVRAQAARRRQPIWLAMAALAVAAPLPVIWSDQRFSTAANRASAKIELQLDPYRRLVARNAGNLARIEETKRQIDAIGSLVESKSNWIVFLNDLQERLAKAEDVWLDKLQVVRPPDGTGSGSVAPPVGRRFTLSGRLLDKNNPVSKVSTASHERVRNLLQLLGQSPFIAAIENERFDNTQPGILRFDFTLVLNPKKSL